MDESTAICNLQTRCSFITSSLRGSTQSSNNSVHRATSPAISNSSLALWSRWSGSETCSATSDQSSHRRSQMPFSVLVGLLFLPVDAAEDAGKGKGEDVKAGLSSFAAAVRYFRTRSPRQSPRDDLDLFEDFYIGLYAFEGGERGDLMFFDVANAPPRARRPSSQEVLSYDEVLSRIRAVYDSRNNPPFESVE
jgi:hypothetical protein